MNAHQVSVLQDKKNSGDGTWRCLHNSVNVRNAPRHLNMIKMVTFMLCILPQFKIKKKILNHICKNFPI